MCQQQIDVSALMEIDYCNLPQKLADWPITGAYAENRSHLICNSGVLFGGYGSVCRRSTS